MYSQFNWAKVPPAPEIAAQREVDIRNVQKHYDALKEANKRSTIGVDSRGDEFKPKHKANFQNVDEFGNEDTKDELPEVDISVALKIIEEEKQKQQDILKSLESKVDTLLVIAQDMNDELKVQSKMLDKIDNDVSKYTAELHKLNGGLDKAITAVGGSRRLLFIAIGLIVLLACVGIAYFALKSAGIF